MDIIKFKYILFILLPFIVYATNFDELDKAPEGAYKGQMFFGGAIGLGIPFGQAVNSENDFINGTTYTFTDSEITKEVDLVHLSFFTSAYAEYMPADHWGIKVMADYLAVYQRTLFGTELENQNEVLYFHYGLMAGPNYHLTVRKPVDISFCPFIGYSLGKYQAAAAASKLFPNNVQTQQEDSKGLLFGAELTTNFYFSGGIYFSIGLNWVYSMITAPENLSRTGPAPAADYKTPDSINTVNLILSFGYAYYN